jgi:hypothetical protein
MITSIAIENFKAVRDRVAFELKPITLLFGPNSAGKSTVLHALHFAREVLERHNLDPDQTLVGGKFIDLGGFRTFVHGHDLSRSIILRFDFDLDRKQLYPAFESLDTLSDWFTGPVDSLYSSLKSAAVTIEVAYSAFHDRIFVKYYGVELNGRPFASICHDPDRRVTALTDLDREHPVLLRPRHWGPVDLAPDELEVQKDIYGDLEYPVLAQCLDAVEPYLPFTGDGSIPLLGQEDALPSFGGVLRLATDVDAAVSESEEPGTGLKAYALLDDLMLGLTQMVVGPGRALRDVLGELCYLGPLRETLPRNFVPVRYPDPSRWANGFAAWDLVFTRPELAEEASWWLSNPEGLALGYAFRVRQHKELPLDSRLMVLLQSDRAFDELEDVRQQLVELPTKTSLTLVDETTGVEVVPQDVGVGISQVIPVLVLALHDEVAFAAVEQPELHVHPAVQVRLGDLFIRELTKDAPRQFLLETHSEHLLLRLLRRIRETHEGELPPGHPGLRPEQVAVVYVEPGESGQGEVGPVRLRHLRIDETGEFMDRWPRGFFEERAEELF